MKMLHARFCFLQVFTILMIGCFKASVVTASDKYCNEKWCFCAVPTKEATNACPGWIGSLGEYVPPVNVTDPPTGVEWDCDPTIARICFGEKSPGSINYDATCDNKELIYISAYYSPPSTNGNIPGLPVFDFEPGLPVFGFELNYRVPLCTDTRFVTNLKVYANASPTVSPTISMSPSSLPSLQPSVSKYPTESESTTESESSAARLSNVWIISAFYVMAMLAWW